MGQDFTRDAFLFFNPRIAGSLRPVLDDRFLRIRGLAMHQPHEAHELVPGLPVRVAVLARVNRGQFPLVFAGEWLDRPRPSRSQSPYLRRPTLRRPGPPPLGTTPKLPPPHPTPPPHA